MTNLVNLREKLERGAEALRYVLNWSDSNSRVKTIMRTVADDRIMTQDRLEALWESLPHLLDLLDAKEARERETREALEDVVNPLGKLRRDAEAQGRKLSGEAYAISDNLEFVKSIARLSLSARGGEK